MTRDEARTQAVKALAVLDSTDDQDLREQYLTELLRVMYRWGMIDANDSHIKRNGCLLDSLKTSLGKLSSILG